MSTAVTILGSTGVIGRNTLDVIRSHSDQFHVAALAAGRNVELLAEQIRIYHPAYVSVVDQSARERLIDLLSNVANPPEIGVGDEGLRQAAAIVSDVVVTAIVGARGIVPTYTAIERGANIALANKETLVAAGDIIMPFAKRHGVDIIPVDSEHSALYQSLRAGKPSEVRRYILTASGGPFRTWPQEQLRTVSPEQALRHPTWNMGRKITIDSATLMNKGLEVIEAHHLFQAAYEQIEVVVHPQSVVHSLVEYCDGSTIAQLGTADMRLPIQYALTHPARFESPWPRLDLLKMSTLTFEAPDMVRFPSLKLAYQAGQAGGFAPCVLNAANEIAVEGFLAGRISFCGMAKLVESVLDRHVPGVPHVLSDVLEMDNWARRVAQSLLDEGGWNC